MQKQLKKRVLALEARIEKLGNTGAGGNVKHLNQVEQNLHDFVRRGREKVSTVEFSLPDLIAHMLFYPSHKPVLLVYCFKFATSHKNISPSMPIWIANAFFIRINP